MRQTLLFGGLETIAHNVNRKNVNLRLFEFGNVYAYHSDKETNDGKALAPYGESFHLGLWLTGKRVSNSWIHPNEDSSVFELKAYVENIFARLGIGHNDLTSKPTTANDVFATSLTIAYRTGKVLATIGIVAPVILAKFDIETEVFYADLDWTALMKAVRNVSTEYTEIAKFPAVKRDLALLIDKNVTFAEIKAVAYETERKLLKDVYLFDVYEGKNLEEGKKSYAISFVLQDEKQTLTDKTIDKTMQKLIKNLQEKLNAKLR